MSAVLVFEKAAPGITLQDGGRRGFRRYGVAVSGAMDRYALALGNAVVGNAADVAALEIAGAGGTVAAEGGTLTLAFAGADVAAFVGDRPVRGGVAFRLQPGEALRFGPVRRGNYAYLALAGGVSRPATMGSLAMHRRSGIGGAGFSVGDRLDLAADVMPRLLAHTGRAPAAPMAIRVVTGPQDDHFTAEALARFTTAPFRVSTRLDRMGCRLDGPALAHAGSYNIVSDGIVPGHIQVPGDGQPIVLLADCQTVGGYPKIATIISADLGRFAQLPPGAEVRFVVVTAEEGRRAAAALAAAIAAIPADLTDAGGDLSSERLLGLDLIGGFPIDW